MFIVTWGIDPAIILSLSISYYSDLTASVEEGRYRHSCLLAWSLGIGFVDHLN